MKDVRSLPSYFSVTLWIVAACLLLLSLFNVSCSAARKGTKVPTYEEAKKDVMARGPLVSPPVEEHYKFLQGGQAGGLPQGTELKIIDPKDHSKVVKVRWGAVVVDEKKAAELKAIKVQRDLLLKKLAAERLRSETTKLIYDAALKQAVEDSKRTWWEKNKATLALVTGGTIVGGLVIGLVYALTRGKGITVNAN